MADLIRELDARYRDYLSDESRLKGHARTISFPQTEEEVRRVLTETAGMGIPVTIQGGRTGISGGGVPQGGHVLNLTRMNRILETHADGDGTTLLSVQPGVTLADLQARLSTAGTFWPPDPTETSATIGGMAGHNAGGPCAYTYGRAVDHIRSIRVMDPEGRVREIGAGNLDHYLGSEGMLGPIVSLDLRLQPDPAEKWAVVFPFQDRFQALAFSLELDRMVQGDQLIAASGGADRPRIAALDFMNRAVLETTRQDLQRTRRAECWPGMNEKADAAVCIEIHGNGSAPVESLLQTAADIADRLGGDADDTRAFAGDYELRRYRAFRHAAMEALLQATIPTGGHEVWPWRLRMDIAVEKADMIESISRMEVELTDVGAEPALLGSAGLGVFQVYLMAQESEDRVRAGRWLEESQAAETAGYFLPEAPFGIGKINPYPLRNQAQMKRVRRLLDVKTRQDPGNVWNPGNMKRLGPDRPPEP